MQESNRIEHKQTLTAGLEKEAVAFLSSSQGGVIHIGINKQGDAVGVENADDVQLKIKDRLKHNIAPSCLGLFEIYSDRIEITSTDGLSSIKNTEDFFTGFTKPINRELMRVFKDVELVEHLGSGMGRILPVYGRQSFQITENFMRLVFDKAVGETTQKTTRERVLEYLQQNNKMTREQLAEAIGVSANAIKQHLANLQKDGLLKREGGRKEGWWNVL